MKVKAWWFTRMTGSCICRNHTILQVDTFQNAVIIFRPLSKKIILNIHNMKSSYTFVNSAELTNASSSWPHSSPGNNHMCVLSCFSRVWLFATPWTVVHQIPLSMEFSRQEYWSGLPFPTPEYIPDSGIQPASLAPPALAGRFFTNSTNLGNPLLCWFITKGCLFSSRAPCSISFVTILRLVITCLLFVFPTEL